jgi:hypothetical protein
MGKDKDRLYFIVKSWFLGQISGIIFLAAFIFLGKIDFFQSLIIGLIAYFFSLATLRVFDSKIDFLVKKILNFLDKHRKIKKFVSKYF